ncbi:MAG: glucosamine-6-phosphate deaminase [Oscillospiraceae bacterium]
MKIINGSTYEGMCLEAAKIIKSQMSVKPTSVLGLATGSTPIGVYKALIEMNNNKEIDFSKTTTVNLDEYVGLSGENDQSYRYFMNTNLFDHVNIDKTKTFVPNGLASDIDGECKRYDKLIEDLGGVDVQILGIGLNGHIGFNEPNAYFDKGTHQVSLTASTIEANARFFETIDEVPKTAVSMGIKTIMCAKKIILLANGTAKSEIIYETCFGNITPNVPASVLQLHPDVTVIVDNDACAAIKNNIN